MNSSKTVRPHDRLYLKENRYKKTLSKFLKNEKSIKNFKFYDFSMKKNLKINHKDYLRSWTFNDNKNKKILINGTNLLHCFSILEINLKK